MEGTTQSLSQTQNVQDIGEPVTLSTDNGTATYSINGRDITVRCNGGTAKSRQIPSNAADSLVDTNPSNFPSQIYYDVGGFTGWIPKQGSYRVFGSQAAETLYNQTWDQAATLVWRFRWTGSSWVRDTSPGSTRVEPPQIYHTDANNHSGWMDYTSWNSPYVPDAPPVSAGQGHPSGYTDTRSVVGSATYTGNLTRPEITTYIQDYYGPVTAQQTYYSYNVTVTYTVVPRKPPYFYWTYPKWSGGDFNLTAGEWNSLMESINAYRVYKLGESGRVSYTSAYAGYLFYYYMFNEAVNMIARINASVPPIRSSGDDIYASYLNRLQDALNEIT